MIAIRRLLWDPGNVAHIARHDVTLEEVEEVCHGTTFVSQTYLSRLRLIGLTASGRTLTVILAPEDEDGDYRPVTARPASRKERERYRTWLTTRE